MFVLCCVCVCICLNLNELTLHKEMKVGFGELLMNHLQQDVRLLLRASMWPGLSPPPTCRASGGQGQGELRGVGEAEGRAINEAVSSDEGQRDGDDVSQTAPAVTEEGHVRNDAEQRSGRPGRKRSWRFVSAL